MLQIFKGNADLQIAESGNTVSDECEAAVWPRSAIKKLLRD